MDALGLKVKYLFVSVVMSLKIVRMICGFSSLPGILNICTSVPNLNGAVSTVLQRRDWQSQIAAVQEI